MRRAVQASDVRIRLLLVDDHPVMRVGLRSLLEPEKELLVVGEASTGVQAIQLAREMRPAVVIMDVSLPELGGAEATKQITSELPETRVLALSEHEEASCARLLLNAGASGYALKRSAADQLVGAVRLVAGGGTYVDPALAAELENRGGRRRSSPDGLLAVSLSERESEVIRLISRGHTSKEIAESLGIGARTLETYKARAMSKLSLRTRADLIRFAERSGWLRDM